ncbi:MAG: reductive dehalogenase [Anaerolineales bacterium]|jgi:ferredoxin
MDKTDEPIHKIIKQFNQGQISRRDFLRLSTLLGLSAGFGEFLSACNPKAATDVPTVTTEAVKGISSDLTPEGMATDVTPPKQIEWYCGCCGGKFRTLEQLKNHAAKEHAWRLPDTQRVDSPTYEQFLTDEIGPFDEKNTCFSRAAWDEPYQAQIAEYAEKAPEPDLEILEGQALVAGSIYADKTAGSLHPYYPGYFGHLHGIGGLYNWEDPVSEVDYPVPDPVWMSERIKQVARFYGANLVGITMIDPRWVYGNFFEPATGNSGVNEISYKYAIVMGIEMDWKGINTSPREGASAATALIYSRMAELAASLAKYIRSLGYPAIPCGNDTTQSIPLAIDAGLGELGRNGLLLTPEYGPRQRLCKVLTDLPLVPDQPVDFGIQKYCESCHACASACPVNAIRFEDRTTEQTSISNRPGILRWPVNVSRCYLFWQENGVDCSNCVAACPWALHSQRDWLEL